MAELKTKAAVASVEKFLGGVPDEERRADAQALCKLMQRISKAKPKMWGSAIVGFGHRKLVYPNGRELDWMQVAFSPRKASLVLYLSVGFTEQGELLSKLGKHKTGKGCLYIQRLNDVDLKILRELIVRSVRHAAST